MRERPIIFNTDMVRAILDGRKTVTRRVIKSNYSNYPCFQICSSNGVRWVEAMDEEGFPPEDSELDIPCPYGKPGDLLIPAVLLAGYDCKYAADGFGRIWSKASGKWKTLKTNLTSGYERLTLRKGGKDVNRTVHKLVCKTWHAKPSVQKKMCVRHLDGDPLNNAPCNLLWGTYKENWDDRKYHRRGINEDHHNSKMTMEMAKEMRDSGLNASQLSNIYPYNARTIDRVLNNETWVENYPNPTKNLDLLPSTRIWLKVKDVRVERVQEITTEDIKAEGVQIPVHEGKIVVPLADENFPFSMISGSDNEDDFWRAFWVQLWDSINKKRGYSYESNPWLWCVDFEVVSTNGKTREG